MLKKIFKRSCLILPTLVIMLFINPGPSVSLPLRFHSVTTTTAKNEITLKATAQARIAVNQMQTAKVPSTEIQLSSVLGPLTYYTQSDVRWGNYLYGGQDPLRTYGCGPTVVSMIVTSFTNTPMTPTQMADWAYDNQCWSPSSGSVHALIPISLSAFGLHVEGVNDRSPQSLTSLLSSGKVLVLLMGAGHFTNTGHFIIVTGITPDGQLCVADPNSPVLTSQTWSPDIIASELRTSANAGGPIWSVSR